MGYKYYTDRGDQPRYQKLIRTDGNTFEQWGAGDDEWYPDPNASGILIGLDEWVWYDEITEKEANKIKRDKLALIDK